ncbi:hypothetical protein AgCh_037445 [Apium graveolens]
MIRKGFHQKDISEPDFNSNVREAKGSAQNIGSVSGVNHSFQKKTSQPAESELLSDFHDRFSRSSQKEQRLLPFSYGLNLGLLLINWLG